ncbi:hypothetical protein [Lentilactobacillus hilgardii]|jgi:hypothetical protein|uniref:Surface layer protein A domain-containing protein n=1 Tax=Lentilactobacillus hilgardii TaxID=1588 RepID=A0A6P1E635_LENHI|nr:hypothetical protein [Lentilactobacillus hilgardii]RRG12331.1 MAG: hypothetical protein DUD35_01800 [Lactobacillus sp.]EEI71538.1 hypothetical protein HMPREF0496_1247 [Lentilactobacillus hilgardii ATCC 27305]MCT3392102.1 hypothetical protein [Lentilactobacillus hilgardii]MCT3399909.1 hypothetical protein [Lentilactobacillus hilgardii]QHB51580.1 hypothetical protein GQR93_04780 [Lentilactobacillus hilgardii]
MKKMTTFIATAALAFPLVFTAPLAASAATKPAQTTQTAAKSTTYTIAKSNFFKKAKVYHTKDATPTVYKALIGADKPTFTTTAKGKLKSGTTYYVTKVVKTAASKTAKAKTFFYVKGQGWVVASALTAGKFQQAD